MTNSKFSEIRQKILKYLRQSFSHLRGIRGFKMNSALSARYIAGAGFLIGGLFLLLSHQLFSASMAGTQPILRRGNPAVLADVPTGPFVQISSTTIPVEIATSTPAVQKGLSGRPSLNPEVGMLFVFSRPDNYRFWMPDMHFPIDIIWIDSNKVVDMDENVSPEFDPLHPRFYMPSKPVQYVLELNAGFVQTRRIKKGDRVIIDLSR